MYEFGSYFGQVRVRFDSSAVLMIHVVCDTTPCWLVNVLNISEEMVHPPLWLSRRYRQQR